MGGSAAASRFQGAGWGRWVGTSLQRFIYEGYSLRPGFMATWETAGFGGWFTSDAPRGEGRVLNVSLVGTGAEGGLQVERVQAEDLPAGASLDVPAVRMRIVVTPRQSWRAKLLPKINRVGLALDSGENEGFFGMGERFSSVNQAGQKLYCWAEDGGWGFGTHMRLPKGKESTYAPVPFFISDHGYGIWLNTTRRTDWDFREAAKGTVSWEVEGLGADMLVILGESPAATLHGFAGMTGRPLIPPFFEFGPWNQFGNELADSGLSEVEQARAFVAMDIPSSVAIIPEHFTPAGIPAKSRARLRSKVAALRALGLPALAYFNSMIATSYTSAYEEAAERGLFATDRRTGRPWRFKYKGAGPHPFEVSLLDVSHPEAVSFMKNLMREATHLGFNGWMYDYGEYVDPRMNFYGGVSGSDMHNLYPVLYQEVAREFFSSPDPAGGVFPAPGEDFTPPHIFYVRSGYTGTGGRTWAHWTGDPYSDWSANSGIKAQVKASLSAGLAGFAFSGSDIGGFVWMEPPSLELWVRWTQLGCLSGLMHMQTGGTSLLGNPKSRIHDWPEGTAIYRRWAKLRTVLFPYLYSAAQEAHAVSLPLMRHHILSFPHDQEATAQDYQYMLGSDILAAPVLDDGQRTQRVYLPKGDLNWGPKKAATAWLDFSSNVLYDADCGRHRLQFSRPLAGGRWVDVSAALHQAPLFVRASAVLFTLDPQVHSLSLATDAGVKDYKSLYHMQHIWLFPDEDFRAEGTSWDGVSVKLATDTYDAFVRSHGGSIEATLSYSDRSERNLVLQLPIPPTKAVSLTSDFALEFPQLEDWWDTAGTTRTGDSSWAYDASASVLWVRVPSAPDWRVVRISATFSAPPKKLHN